jgi:hypothetical protein
MAPLDRLSVNYAKVLERSEAMEDHLLPYNSLKVSLCHQDPKSTWGSLRYDTVLGHPAKLQMRSSKVKHAGYGIPEFSRCVRFEQMKRLYEYSRY